VSYIPNRIRYNLTGPNRILIHAPYGGKKARLGSWDALVEAQKAGKVRSIGISNYGIHHLEELEDYIQGGGGGQIDVGQYELHPWLDHSDIVEWLQKRKIVVEAYSPLAHGSRLTESVLLSIGKKYGKTPAQVMIRWSLQMVSDIDLIESEGYSNPDANSLLGICASAQVNYAEAHSGECRCL
jgi:diketogulonate reductase-like aldo/keto reductase